jgi:hypothetical protein
MSPRKSEFIFDPTLFVIKYENGDLNRDQVVDGFQYLIDTGIVWRLQGSYGRMAKSMIEAGYCHECEGK